MVAKRLAYHSGLDFAIMSGADVAPLGSRAVTEIHDIFAWANSSSKGLILLIDEADAFLASRGKANMSEDLRNALNAILFHTGTQSDKFMLILATNRPGTCGSGRLIVLLCLLPFVELTAFPLFPPPSPLPPSPDTGDLDAALTNRIDETQEFGLPGLAERQCLVFLYFARYVSGDIAVRAKETRAAQEAVARKRGASLRGKDIGEPRQRQGRRRRQERKLQRQQQRQNTKRKKSPAARNQQGSVGSDESETEERDSSDVGGVGGAGVASRGLEDSDRYSSNDEQDPRDNDDNDQGRVDNVAAIKAKPNERRNAKPSTLKRLVEVGSKASTKNAEIALDGVDCTDLLMIARDVRGFSGRDIAKLMVGIQAAVYGSEKLTLAREALLHVARERISQFKTKKWLERESVGW